MVYFSGGFALAGLPLPGTLRMASRADSGYIASFTSGLMPAVSSRLWTVLYGIPSSSDNSCIVKPFTSIYSASLVFRGCPGLGTALRMSKTSGAYIASLVIGFIPSRVSRCRRVLTVTSSSVDISESVKPVISSIIGKFIKNLYKCTVKSTNIYTNVKHIHKKIVKIVLFLVQRLDVL